MAKELAANRLALTVEQMRTGESAYVESQRIIVNSERHAFIIKNTVTGPTNDGIKTVKIERTDHGFSIDIKQAAFTWSTQTIQPATLNNYFPIEEIIE